MINNIQFSIIRGDMEHMSYCCALFRVTALLPDLISAMLQHAVSSVDDYEFEVEEQLEKQVGSRPLPFPKMDSKCYLDMEYCVYSVQ